MEQIFPDKLITLLSISVSFSFVIMALIQKIKKLSFINHKIYIWICNLVFSFSLSIPFGIEFYDISFVEGLWVGLFTFIGAPTLYKTFKAQNIITYHPESLNDTKSIPIENEIKIQK